MLYIYTKVNDVLVRLSDVRLMLSIIGFVVVMWSIDAGHYQWTLELEIRLYCKWK